MWFIEFHRLGVRFEEPQMALGVNAEIHRHLAQSSPLTFFDLFGDSKSGLARLTQYNRCSIDPEYMLQQHLRILDRTATWDMGSDASATSYPCPDPSDTPTAFAVLLHKYS